MLTIGQKVMLRKLIGYLRNACSEGYKKYDKAGTGLRQSLLDERISREKDVDKMFLHMLPEMSKDDKADFLMDIRGCFRVHEPKKQLALFDEERPAFLSQYEVEEAQKAADLEGAPIRPGCFFSGNAIKQDL